MSGCLYSVGVGPGDPELMTLKAVKIIRNCQVLVLPAESKEKCVAYQIVRRAIPEIEDKTTVCLVMPMTKDKDRLEKSHREGTQKVAEVLDAGKDAAFLTLGDPTVYATSMYIHQRIAGMGYRTSIAILCKTNNRCFHTVIDPYRLYLYQIRSWFLLLLEMPS